MAAMMEPSGLWSSAASSAAFNTQNAASKGESLATTMLVTKLLKLDSTLETQGLEMLPPRPGMLIPCAANQDRTWGSVSRITDHSAHRWKPPPAWKFTPPSRRRAIPASTIVHMAAGTARSNSSFIKSTRICGNVMLHQLLLNSLGSVRDPEFNQAGETGDHEQSAGCDGPAR